MTTDLTRQSFKTLVKSYLTATDRFAKLVDDSATEISLLETLDQRITDLADAMFEKALTAGRDLRADVNGRELAITLDGHIMTR